MYKLPERLKHIRSSRNLTQTQIAAKLGMTYQEYQKIETGKTVIRADKLVHICETLDISSDDLLGLKATSKEMEVVKIEGIVESANKGRFYLTKQDIRDQCGFWTSHSYGYSDQ